MNLRGRTVGRRHRGDEHAFNFIAVLRVGYHERGKVCPEVVIPSSGIRGVRSNATEEFFLGLANVVGLVIPEQDIHPRLSQAFLNFGPAVEVEHPAGPHLGRSFDYDWGPLSHAHFQIPFSEMGRRLARRYFGVIALTSTVA